MAVKHIYTVVCDCCGKTFRGGWANPGVAMDEAGKAGWNIVPNGLHNCPKCYGRLSREAGRHPYGV